MAINEALGHMGAVHDVAELDDAEGAADGALGITDGSGGGDEAYGMEYGLEYGLDFASPTSDDLRAFGALSDEDYLRLASRTGAGAGGGEPGLGPESSYSDAGCSDLSPSLAP